MREPISLEMHYVDKCLGYREFPLVLQCPSKPSACDMKGTVEEAEEEWSLLPHTRSHGVNTISSSR